MTSSYVIVPQGWQREVAVGQEYVYYISPDKRTLRNREELLLHLTSQGTCKCGLRCPFRFDEQFNFDPTVLGLPDNSDCITDNQLLCEIGHRFQSETTIKVKPKHQSKSLTKLRLPKTSPSTTKRLVLPTSAKKREGVKRLQVQRPTESAKVSGPDEKEISISCVTNSAGVSPGLEATGKDGNKAGSSASEKRKTTLAALLKTPSDLSWLTELGALKLAELQQQQEEATPLSPTTRQGLELQQQEEATPLSPTTRQGLELQQQEEEATPLSPTTRQGLELQQQQEEATPLSPMTKQGLELQQQEEATPLSLTTKQGSFHSSAKSNETSAIQTSSPKVAVQLHTVEEKQTLSNEGKEEPISTAAPLQGKLGSEELKVSIQLGRTPSTSVSDEAAASSVEEAVNTLLVSIPRGEGVSDSKQQPGEEDNDSKMESSQTATSHSGTASVRVESSPSDLSEIRSREVMLSASEPTVSQGSERVGSPEPDIRNQDCVSDCEKMQPCLDDGGTERSEFSSLAVSWPGEGERRLEDSSSQTAGVGGVSTAEGGKDHHPVMDLEHGGTGTMEEDGGSCVSTAESNNVDSSFEAEGELRVEASKDEMSTTPHSPTELHAPVANTAPESINFNGGFQHENANNEGVQSDSNLQNLYPLTPNLVGGEENQRAFSPSHSLCHSSSPPVPLVTTKYSGGWSLRSYYGGKEPKAPSLVTAQVNGTCPVGDQLGTLTVSSPCVQEPWNELLEEVMLVPMPEAPSSVLQSDIHNSTSSQSWVNTVTSSSVTTLGAPQWLTTPALPVNGVDLPIDALSAPSTAVSTSSLTSNAQHPLPIATNGMPLALNPLPIFTNGTPVAPDPLSIPDGDTAVALDPSPIPDGDTAVALDLVTAQVNGTCPVGDQLGTLTVSSPCVQEPWNELLEEVMLVPMPEAPSSVLQSDIHNSTSSQSWVNTITSSSVTTLGAPQWLTTPALPVNGVDLPIDALSAPSTAVSTSSLTSNAQHPLPIATNGMPLALNPLPIFTNGTPVAPDPLSIPDGDTAVALDPSPIPDGDTAVALDPSPIPDGDTPVAPDPSPVPDGNTAVAPDPSPIPDGDSPVGPDPSPIPDGNTPDPSPIPDGDTAVALGPSPIPDGDTAVALGPSPIPDGNTPVGPDPSPIPDGDSPVAPDPSPIPDGDTAVAPDPSPIPDGDTPVGPDPSPIPDGNTPVAPDPSPIPDGDSPVAPDPSPIPDGDTAVGPDPSPIPDGDTAVGPDPSPIPDGDSPVAPDPSPIPDGNTPVAPDPSPIPAGDSPVAPDPSPIPDGDTPVTPADRTPSLACSQEVQDAGVSSESSAAVSSNYSSPLKMPFCAATFSPKRSPSKDIAMRDFHIPIKPLREFSIRKRRSSEMSETEDQPWDARADWKFSPKRQRFSNEGNGKVVSGDAEGSRGHSKVDCEGEQIAMEVESKTATGELVNSEQGSPEEQLSKESAKLVAVLPMDLNIVDLVSMFQDSGPDSEPGSGTSNHVPPDHGIGNLAAQIVDAAGTQGYIEGASSILVLSHQSPELEAILQAAVTPRVEPSSLPQADLSTETDAGTASNNPSLESESHSELDTSQLPLDSNSPMCTLKDKVSQERERDQDSNETTSEEQHVADLSASAEAVDVTVKDAVEKNMDIICHPSESHGHHGDLRGKGSVSVRPGSECLDSSKQEMCSNKDDVHSRCSQTQERQPLHSRPPSHVQLVEGASELVSQSAVPPGDSSPPKTVKLDTCVQRPTTADRNLESIQESGANSADCHDAQNSEAREKGGMLVEDKSVTDLEGVERDLTCLEVLASSSTSSLADYEIGSQTGSQTSVFQPAVDEEVRGSEQDVTDSAKSDTELVAGVLLQLSGQYTSGSVKVGSPGDLEALVPNTGGSLVARVAPTTGVGTQGGASEDLKEQSRSAIKEEKEAEMSMEQSREKCVDDGSSADLEDRRLQGGDKAEVATNVAQIDSTGNRESLKCEEPMEQEDSKGASSEESGKQVKESDLVVKNENTSRISRRVTRRWKSFSPELKQQKSSIPEDVEEDGKWVKKSSSESPPSERSSRRTWASVTSSDQDTDTLRSSSGSTFSLASSSDAVGHSTSSSPTTSTSISSSTPTKCLPISRGKHKPSPIATPHPKRLIVSIPLSKVSIIHYTVLECYPTPVFGVGDIVWAKASMLPAWPGKIISHTTRKKSKLEPPPKGKFWVEWFGDGTISLVEEETVRTLKDGLQNRKKSHKNKKLSKRLHEAVKEAFKAQKKQLKGKKKS